MFVFVFAFGGYGVMLFACVSMFRIYFVYCVIVRARVCIRFVLFGQAFVNNICSCSENVVRMQP